MTAKTLLGKEYLFDKNPHFSDLGDVYAPRTTGSTRTPDHVSADGREWEVVYGGSWASFAATVRKRAKDPEGKPIKGRVAGFYRRPGGSYIYVSGTTKNNLQWSRRDHRWYFLMWNCTDVEPEHFVGTDLPEGLTLPKHLETSP